MCITKSNSNDRYAIVFASTQLRITTLRKFPIDPKAYLGRSSEDVFELGRISGLFSVYLERIGHLILKLLLCNDIL